jgi:hypothetical protein
VVERESCADIAACCDTRYENREGTGRNRDQVGRHPALNIPYPYQCYSNQVQIG